MNASTVENILKTEICRLCLSYTKVYFSLTQNKKVAEILEAVTAIKIQPDEGIPSIMCYKCRLNLNLAYIIRRNMIKAEERFRARFFIVNTKEEIDYSLVKNDWSESSSDVEFPELEQLKQMCGETPTTMEDTLYVPKIEEKTTLEQTTNFVNFKKENEFDVVDLSIDSLRSQINTQISINEYIEETSQDDEFERDETTDFFCDMCNKYFENSCKLSNHKREVHIKVPCPECGIEMGKAALRRHMGRRHPGVNLDLSGKEKQENLEYICDICNKHFKNRDKLGNHKRDTHTRIRCPVCGKEMLKKCFKRHALSRHPGRNIRLLDKQKPQEKTEFVCVICNKYFLNRHKLECHRREIHTRINCPVCAVEMVKKGFKRHVLSLHPDHSLELLTKELPSETYECEVCAKTFSAKFQYDKHKTNHKKWTCPICGKQISNDFRKKHMDRHEDQEYKKKNLDEGDEKTEIFTCEVCGKQYTKKWILLKHMYHHKKSKCPICSKEVLKCNLHNHMQTHSDSHRVTCELCGITSTNKNNLRAHMIQIHQDARFKCNFCDKRFAFKTARRLHEHRIHLDEKNFVCDLCGKKFCLGIQLREHVNKTHLKLGQKTCEVCKKVFSSRHALQTHVRIHTNETPYKCQECGEGFRQKVSLRSHLKSKHNIEEEITHFCKVCGKGFASDMAVKTHERIHDK